MNFKPLGDRILIKRVDAETITPGGIMLPAGDGDPPIQGEVIACGPGAHQGGTYVHTKLHEGDKILFGKYSGSPVKIDGADYLVMREEDVLGVFE